LEFFLRHLYLDHDGWNLIFYTGKEELEENVDIFSNTNVCIILGRPKLAKLIPNIIYGIESERGLPEQRMVQTLADRVDEDASIELDAIFDHLDFGFKPWECHPKAHSYVKELSPEDVMATWGMMYCGGARVLEIELKKISETYHVDLHIDSFGW
jgi:hypothetical protein